MKHTILFLAANPQEGPPRASDQEAKAIQRQLPSSGVVMVTRWAVEPLDLLGELRAHNPTVVHFSGRGSPGGLIFQASDGGPRTVAPAALAETFEAAGRTVKVVVLSACDSHQSAERLLAHVECVVSMPGKLDDAVAKAFASGFYGALAKQSSVTEAYRHGNAAIGLESLAEEDRPQLKVRPGHDATRPVLVREPERFDDLLEGIPDPAPLRAFLAHYLGSDDHPCAFGGRQDTMARLRAWIDDPGAPSHCFLVAPSGRGKSAVVAHVVAEYASRADLAIVFVPVSNLFETNRSSTVISSLVARIATVHRESPPKHLEWTAPRGLFGTYMRRPLGGDRRLLLVLDGIDEAADWELDPVLLPTDIARGTKVLLSVRGEPGTSDEVLLRQLALRRHRVVTERLDVLDRAGVAEALRTIKQDRLAADPDGLKRVLDLSEGDPLQLELLIDLLQSSQTDWLSPDALPPDLRPGLASIWDLQLRPRDRDALGEDGENAAVLGVLGCALGPVEDDDIIRITRGEVRNRLALDRVVARLGRFVHRGEAGYSFSHPRLREYVVDKVLSPDDRTRWEQRLVDDGRDLVHALAIGSDPGAASRFVLRFHAAHLRRSNAPVEAWLELVSNGWRRAWATLDPHQAGFLGDVEHARTAASAANRAAVAANAVPPFLDAVVRCALCAASVQSQTTNLRPELLHRLVSVGIWSPAQALAHITATADDASRFDTKLRPMIPILDRATRKLALELVTARIDRNPREQLDLWHAFIAPMIQLDVDELLDRARSLRRRDHRAEALFAIAAAVDDRAELRTALRREASTVLADLDRPFAFLGAVMNVLGFLDEPARNDLLEQALTVATMFYRGDDRAGMFVRLGRLCTNEHGARAILDAVRLACQSDTPGALLVVLDSLMPTSQDTIRTGLDLVLNSGRLNGLADWLMGSVSPRWRWLSQHLDERRRDLVVGEVVAIARKQWRRGAGTDGLRAVAEMSGPGRALQIIRGSRDKPRRWTGLVQLADLLPTDEQLAVLQEMRDAGAIEEAREVLRRISPRFDIARVDDLAEIFDGRDLPSLEADLRLWLSERLESRERVALAWSATEAALRVRDPVDRIDLLARAYEVARTGSALTALVEELARLPDGGRSLRRQTVQRLIRCLDSTERSRVLRLLGHSDEIDTAAIYLGNADELLRSVGRVGISRLANPVVRLKAYLRFSELTSDPQECRAAVEAALATSREVDDAGDACGLAASMQPDAAMLREIVDRLLRIADAHRRFRALTGVLAHAGPLRGEVVAACIETAPALFLDEQAPSLWFFMGHAEPARQQAVAAELFEEVRRRAEQVRDVLARWRETPADDLEDARVALGEPRGGFVRGLHSLLFQIAAHLPVACVEETLAFIPWQWTGIVLQLLVPLDAHAERRTEIIAELVRLARIRRGHTRGPLLACLVPHVPPDARPPMIGEALHEARVFVPGPGADPKDNRGAVLGHLAPYLDESHLERIVELARDAWRDSRGAGAFVATLRPELRTEVARRLVDVAARTTERELLIARLAAHVPDADLDRVVQAFAATYQSDRTVLDVLRERGVAERFTGARLETLFALAVEASRRGSSRPWDSTIDAIAQLGCQRLRASRAHAAEVLELVEHLLNTRANDRAQLLSTIRSLSPLLSELGGPEAMTGIARSILEVTSWWP